MLTADTRSWSQPQSPVKMQTHILDKWWSKILFSFIELRIPNRRVNQVNNFSTELGDAKSQLDQNYDT
tara:strand:+ start:1375 stop:1578 length:204 start_codon:yes stop_codon:yes gene_type:complete